MRNLIVADIHGQYDELMIALENCRYDETADRLIVLGDVIDRGNQSKAVLDFLADLVRRGKELVMLRGNHEHVLQTFLKGRVDLLKVWLEAFQGATLLRSYGYSPARLRFAGERTVADGKEIATVDDARSFLLAVMGEEHLSLMEGMREQRLVIRRGLWGRDLTLCHAGLKHKTVTRETPRWLFVWGDPKWENGRSADYQPITVYGHFHQLLRPLVRFRRVCLAMNSAVAVMVLEEELIVTSDGHCMKIRPAEVLGHRS